MGAPRAGLFWLGERFGRRTTSPLKKSRVPRYRHSSWRLTDGVIRLRLRNSRSVLLQHTTTEGLYE